MGTKTYRDCPKCGLTYGSVIERGICPNPNCLYECWATPTHSLLAGKVGACGLEGLVKAIADFHGLPALVPLIQPVCTDTFKLLDPNDAFSYQFVPVRYEEELVVAIDDPLNIQAVDCLTSTLGELPRLAVALSAQLSQRVWWAEAFQAEPMTGPHNILRNSADTF